MKKPLVFISYASDEVELADFLKQILLRISADTLEVFVAKRDISSGDNPLKVMLDENLKAADAIIPICSRKAKNTSWVWWESASVWAKTGKIYPLFTNISADEFGGPLILVVQGKDYFVKNELIKTLSGLCDKFKINIEQPDFADEEYKIYVELENKYSKNIESAHVELGYDIIRQTQALHTYSLNFAIQNKTASAFEDIVLELYFPEKYMERKKWTYDHLRSSLPDNMPGYLCLTFEYNNLLDRAKRQFSANLLPG
ncbi:MAG: toll/interleukin-1 receptor domain-containing protein, partial [Nitrospirae bacterium]|nr:toll/interleukin-1 receptor domain-containing protein [Nitrospirota bacterium]